VVSSELIDDIDAIVSDIILGVSKSDDYACERYPFIASSRSPPPAELWEVGASEAKLREGVFGMQVCHLTIAALGPHPNVA